jgi:hypothetical protein
MKTTKKKSNIFFFYNFCFGFLVFDHLHFSHRLVPEKQAEKFIKYYGTPMWADLTNDKNKKKKKRKPKAAFKINKKGMNEFGSDSDQDEEEEDSDLDEDENFFQQTGDFLANSGGTTAATSSLPKTTIDIKTCTDANKEDTPQVNKFLFSFLIYIFNYLEN